MLYLVLFLHCFDEEFSRGILICLGFMQDINIVVVKYAFTDALYQVSSFRGRFSGIIVLVAIVRRYVIMVIEW